MKHFYCFCCILKLNDNILQLKVVDFFVQGIWSKATMTARKGTAKLNELLDIEQLVQENWKRDKVFEADGPAPGSDEAKYVLTCDVLPLERDFSVSKREFCFMCT